MALLAASCTFQSKIPDEYAQNPTLEIVSGKTVVFDAAGGSTNVVFDTEDYLIVSVTGKWLKASVAGNTATLTAEPNAEITARYSELTAVAGGKTCKLMVQQSGLSTIFTLQEDWTINVDVADDYSVSVHIAVADGTDPGSYYAFVVSDKDVRDSGASGDLSLFLSLNNNGEARKAGKTVYSAGTDLDEGVYDRGKYYAFVVGLQGGHVNYTYQAVSFNVLYPYDRWLGVWRTSTAAGSSESWTIKEGVQDESYRIFGMAGGDELPTLAVFNPETGGFSVSEQENVGKQLISGDECDMSLYGCIAYNGGHPYWGEGLTIFTTALGEDWESGTVAAGTVNSTYGKFVGYAYYGSVDGEISYWLGYKDLPVTMTLDRRF